MQKKTKIIIAVVCAVVVAAGVALGLYFGLNKADPHGTVYSETGTVDVFDSNTVKFYYTAPYIEEGSFSILDKKAFEITAEDKTIGGKIISVEYHHEASDTIETGEIIVTVDLTEKLVADTSYHAVLKAGAIEHKLEEYVNEDVTSDFKVKKDDNGVLQAEEEKYKDVKAVVLSDVEPEFFFEGDKAYFAIRAKADGITCYDEVGTQNFEVFAGYRYKTSEGGFVRWLNRDVHYEIEDGNIYIVGTANKEDIIPGTDYKLVIKKGFFTNDDKTIVNEEYETTFTYVEK